MKNFTWILSLLMSQHRYKWWFSRSETKRTTNFISIIISFNKLIIIQSIIPTEWKFPFYSNITLQSLSLDTWELKVQIKKLRIVCSWEFVHIRVKEASQKNIIMKLYEGTISYYIFIRQVSQMELFYLNQSEEDIQCASIYREGLDSVLSS
jgi:hypothetical protein